MKIDTNKLADFYAQTNQFLLDSASYRICPGSRAEGWTTNERGGGLVFPLEGSARYTLNGVPYLLRSGMIVHAGPSMKLNKEVVGGKPWRYALIHYRIPEEEKNPSSFYHQHFSIATGIPPKLTEILYRLLESSGAQGSLAALRKKSLFQGLIEEIILSAQKSGLNDENNLVEDAVSFIHEHYHQRFSIAQLAQRYDINPKRFAELFQRHAGISPVRYLTEFRIRRSQELLKSSDCTVTQLAQCVGYEDSYYFSRQFKKITGVSPTEFRTTEKIHLLPEKSPFTYR